MKTTDQQRISDAVLAFYEKNPFGGDSKTDDGHWSRLPWMENEFGLGTRDGQLMLDLGCGIGIDTLRFVRGGATVVGTDYASAPLLAARERLRGGIL